MDNKVSRHIKQNTLLQDINKNKQYFIMAAPALLFLIVFSYLPMGGAIVAFKEFNYSKGIFGSPWNGLANFEFFFKSGQALHITLNTIFYNTMFIITNTVFGVLLALFISEIGGRTYKKITQSLIFIPYFMSWVVIATIVYNIFNLEYGVLNTTLKSLGKNPVDVYTNEKIWYLLMPLFKAWKEAGWGSILYFAAIMGIDQECFEAADIDGASIFQKIRHITIPMIVPTMIILTLLNLGTIVKGDLNMFYQIIGDNGLLFNSTDIIDTYVFRSLIRSQDIASASAAGLFQSVLGFIIILSANKLVKIVRPDYSLF